MKTYLIGAGQMVKIGRSRDPERRLRKLQTGSPSILRLLVVLDGDHEETLHKRFQAEHIQREWFTLSSRIREFVKAQPTLKPSAFEKLLDLYHDLRTQVQLGLFGPPRAQQVLDRLHRLQDYKHDQHILKVFTTATPSERASFMASHHAYRKAVAESLEQFMQPPPPPPSAALIARRRQAQTILGGRHI
jgi:hypothetical protein